MHTETRRWATGSTEPNSWLEKGARAGHVAKGVIYALVGILALKAAWGSGGQVGGGEEAARFVHQQPFGQVLLVLLGVGLTAYAVWRLVVGIKDTEGAGNDAKGWVKRIGAIASGLINGALAVVIFQMVLAQRSGGGGAESWVGKVLQQPFGYLLVGGVGGAVVLAAVMQAYQAYAKRFLRFLDLSDLNETERHWLTRLGQWGHVARGAVFLVIGGALIQAALDHNAAQTKDTGEALREIATSSFGQVLLALVAAGFVAYAVFLFASARYRRVSVE